ncbi:hypothetical protein [Azospirillum melinis]
MNTNPRGPNHSHAEGAAMAAAPCPGMAGPRGCGNGTGSDR